MKSPDLTLVVLAAGTASRYGSLKQLEPVGPNGEALMDYSAFDAIRSGFSRIIYVIRPEIEHQVRKHSESVFAGSAQLLFAHQTLQDIPSQFAVPTARSKPWGTAHATLVTEQFIQQPFAVCNADDFYGASAYKMLAHHLTSMQYSEHKQTAKGKPGTDTGEPRSRGTGEPGHPGTWHHALIGYRLRDTLSPHGGVSRAICCCDTEGYLEVLTEVKQIRDDGGQLGGVSDQGQHVKLCGDELVSMNLWGFAPDLFPYLRRQFDAFMSAAASCDEEFLIPTAVNQLVALRQAKLTVLQASECWMGMTFAQDKARVQRKILELVDQGVYPEDLKVGLAGQG